jgi:hypothetical protein
MRGGCFHLEIGQHVDARIRNRPLDRSSSLSGASAVFYSSAATRRFGRFARFLELSVGSLRPLEPVADPYTSVSPVRLCTRTSRTVSAVVALRQIADRPPRRAMRLRDCRGHRHTGASADEGCADQSRGQYCLRQLWPSSGPPRARRPRRSPKLSVVSPAGSLRSQWGELWRKYQGGWREVNSPISSGWCLVTISI